MQGISIVWQRRNEGANTLPNTRQIVTIRVDESIVGIDACVTHAAQRFARVETNIAAVPVDDLPEGMRPPPSIRNGFDEPLDMVRFERVILVQETHVVRVDEPRDAAVDSMTHVPRRPRVFGEDEDVLDHIRDGKLAEKGARRVLVLGAIDDDPVLDFRGPCLMLHRSRGLREKMMASRPRYDGNLHHLGICYMLNT